VKRYLDFGCCLDRLLGFDMWQRCRTQDVERVCKGGSFDERELLREFPEEQNPHW